MAGMKSSAFAMQDKPECKGLIFRASDGMYLSTHRSLEHRVSLRLLKRKSCPGCPECDWLWELIEEDLSETSEFFRDIKPGKMYTPHVSFYHNWEGCGEKEVDGIEMMEVKES